MKKWLKATIIIVCTIFFLVAAFATHLYFLTDDRVEITEVQPFDNINAILRLDSSSITPDSATRYIDKLRTEANVAGLGVSIINNGKIVYQNYFGERNHPRSEAMRAGTIFYGASFSKTLLADVTLQLVTSGHLHLDSPLYQYLPKPLPEYRTNVVEQFFGATNYDYSDLGANELYKQVTARMCLTHTTGLPNWRWIEPDGRLKFKYKPGERYSYSGEGMFLLQLVLEELTQMSFEQLAVDKIFVPAGMSASSFVWQRGYEGNYAIGHDSDGNFLGIPKSNSPNAAGSLSTSLEDFTSYFNIILNQSEDRYRQMITQQVSIPFKQQFGPEASEETHDNDSISLGYGLGYGVYKTPYGVAFFKEGHGDGWQHYAVGFPERKTALILMSNSDNAEYIFKELIEFTTANTYTPWYWENYIPRK